MDGFREEVERIKQLGFDGKSVINPRQIPVVNKVYAPTEKEIQNAKEVIWEFVKLKLKDQVLSQLTVKWSIKPIVERAERVIALAKAAGLISEEEI